MNHPEFQIQIHTFLDKKERVTVQGSYSMLLLLYVFYFIISVDWFVWFSLQVIDIDNMIEIQLSLFLSVKKITLLIQFNKLSDGWVGLPQNKKEMYKLG